MPTKKSQPPLSQQATLLDGENPKWSEAWRRECEARDWIRRYKLQIKERGRRAADAWWRELQLRHTHRNTHFTVEGDLSDHTLPAELFDSVADNLIENALRKDAAIVVTVSCVPATHTLRVADNGDALSATRAAQLFSAPVASSAGLGVGLYHAASHAAQAGYALTLTENRPGRVVFQLARKSLNTRRESQ